MFPSDYYGNNMRPFFGIVEDKIDEVFVKVRVFGIHPLDKTAVTTEMLPPAQVIYPVTGGQVSSGATSHNIAVDSWVMGYWLDYPQCQHPIVTGVIQGGEYSMSTYSSQGGVFVGQGGSNSSSSSTSDVDVDATTNIPGNSNVQKVYNYIYSRLQKEGSSSDLHLHTSAAIGVIQDESGQKINPNAVNKNGGAYGICQWLDRRPNLFRRTGTNKPNLQQQLDFMWWELNGPEKRAKGMWLRATNLPDAVAGFNAFERDESWIGKQLRSDRSHPNYKRRLQNAYKIYNSMKSTGNITTTSSTSVDTTRTPGGSV